MANNVTTSMLDIKRAALDRMRSTLRKDLFEQVPSSRSFLQQTRPAVAYPAAGAGPIVIASYRVPSGTLAVLNKLAVVHIGAGFVDGSGNVIWRLLVNGAAEKGFENVLAQIGSIAQPSDMALVLAENDLVQVTVEVPAGAPAAPPAGTTTAAHLQGWLDVGGRGGYAPASQGGAGTGAAPASTSTPSGTGTGTTSGSTGTSSGGTVRRFGSTKYTDPNT